MMTMRVSCIPADIDGLSQADLRYNRAREIVEEKCGEGYYGWLFDNELEDTLGNRQRFAEEEIERLIDRWEGE